MKTQIDSQKNQIGNLEASIKSLSKEKSASETKAQQLLIEKELASIGQKDLEELKECNMNLKSLLTEKENELMRLGVAIEEEKRKQGAFWKKKRGNDIRTLEEMIQKTQEKFENLSLELLTLKSEHEKKLYEIQTMRKELEFLSSQKGSLENEVGEYKHRCRDLEDELKVTKSDRDKQFREYDTMSNRYRVSKTECKDLKKEIDEVNSNLIS